MPWRKIDIDPACFAESLGFNRECVPDDQWRGLFRSPDRKAETWGKQHQNDGHQQTGLNQIIPSHERECTRRKRKPPTLIAGARTSPVQRLFVLDPNTLTAREVDIALASDQV